jgi:trans-aconitate methyltransferase
VFLFISLTNFLLLANEYSDYWDGEKYHQHSSSQKDAASDLMKYISLTGSESILDIGCGDGKITAAITKWNDLRY